MILKTNIKNLLLIILTALSFVSLKAVGTKEVGIYYGNAKIYGKEYMFVKHNDTRQTNRRKNTSRVAKKAVVNIEKEVTKVKEKTVSVVPVFPFLPSAYCLHCNDILAVIISRYRISGHQQMICHVNMRDIILSIQDSKIYLRRMPELRHKFSPVLTQCGILTSYGPHSPTVV